MNIYYDEGRDLIVINGDYVIKHNKEAGVMELSLTKESEFQNLYCYAHSNGSLGFYGEKKQRKETIN